MSTNNNDDLFLVQRGGDLHSIPFDEMSTIQDTDLLLVSRGGVNYKMEAQDLPLIPPELPVASGNIVYDDINANRFTEEQFTITAGAQPEAQTVTTSIKPYVVGLFGDVQDDFTHGLRFDGDRETNLYRTGGETASWTLSAWVKPTGHRNAGYILGDPDKVGVYLANSGNAVSIRDGTNNHTLSGALPDNAWTHVVVVYDAVNTTAIAYIDGVEQTALSKTVTVGNLTSYSIGKYNASNFFGGYLSEVYLIDGLILDPSVFAHSVDGFWVPKETADVSTGITNSKVQPYDTRPNMEDDWSSYYVSQNSESGEAFDGNITTFAAPDPGGSLEWNYTINSGVLRLLLKKDLNGPDLGCNVTDANGVQALDLSGFANGTSSWLDITNLVTYPVTKIQWYKKSSNSEGTQVGAVELDGRILVDGPADNSQNWSDYLSSNYSVRDGGNAFDGDTTTNGQGWDGISNTIPPAGFYDLVFEPPSPIPGPVSVFLNTAPGSPYNNGWQVDTGSGYTALNYSYSQSSWVEIVPNGQSLIKFRMQGDQNGTSFAAMKYGSDGKILIDAGAQWDTSQVWSNGAVFSPSNSFNDTSGRLAFIGLPSAGLNPGGSAGTCTISFTQFSSISSVDIYAAHASGLLSNANLSINGTPVAGLANNSWATYDVTGAGLQSITFGNNGSGKSTTLKAIRVDGKILVDAGNFGTNGFHLPFDPATGIGTDASGQDNHFEDSGFNTLPLKIIPSDNWTAKVSGPSRSGFEPSNAFNGSTTGGGWVPAISGAQTFTPNGGAGIPFTTLAVYGYVDTGATNVLSVNGVDVTDKLREGPNAGTIRRAVLSDVPGVTSPLVSIVSTSQGSASNALVSAVEIDGAILVDNKPSISPGPDTVEDTSYTDYAVFDQEASNGNLTKTANTTRAYSTIKLTGKRYCEYTIKDTGAGSTIGVHGTGGSIVIEPTGAYRINGANTGTDAAISYAAGDIMGLAYDTDTGDLQVYKNGSLGRTITNLLTDVQYGSTVGVQANFGQQPFVHTIPGGYTGLYQQRGAIAATSRLYCTLDGSLNVTDLQEADPGFTLVNSPATVTFPATLPTGNAPDVEIPEAASFGSDIEVTNKTGTGTTTLNQVTPT